MKNLKLFLVAIVAIFFIAACQKDDEGNRVTYYKTIGEGYIYDGKYNRPLKGATVTVESICGTEILFYMPKTQNTFTTDENGYYQVRFVKRANVGAFFNSWVKTTHYIFEYGHGPMIPPSPPPPPYGYWGVKSEGFQSTLSPEDIKDKKKITFDTVKYYPNWDY